MDDAFRVRLNMIIAIQIITLLVILGTVFPIFWLPAALIGIISLAAFIRILVNSGSATTEPSSSD
jgi:hypothetical protein